MNIGIVGHAADKFTPLKEQLARELIRSILSLPDAVLVSGRCHLGGVDVWAEEEADKLGLKKMIFPAKTHRRATGYKPRNLLIANFSDVVHVIVVKEYPEGYNGMRFKYCYHCGTDTHVKSGGCWTGLQAKKMGKPWVTYAIGDRGASDMGASQDEQAKERADASE